ncbi:Hypothetical predicted protein [Cloeon dipterum]|uniref:E3 ubiquitin-protein ligase n=1 Tax=Cloeon dipterum TaxID=197152 RepID=A0A8S1E640_9INSE|nr:Hypothetical predicted protein [Cloeon dipterum]
MSSLFNRFQSLRARMSRNVQRRPERPSSDESSDEEQAAAAINNSMNTSLSQQECSVCISVVELPVRLPCAHLFCYTCAKGLAQTSNSCAMCRSPIPIDFLLEPDKYVVGIIKEPSNEHSWFYMGCNGWWMYEPRVQTEIEEAFKSGEKTFEALIAGHLYVVDFDNMFQYRKDFPSKRRKIKRDLTSSSHKGLAGLKQEMRPEFPLGKE